MTILVAIPWKGAGELLNRAVASVLGQTITDIAVAVIGDGEDPVASGWLHPSSYLDSRVTVYTLPENRGPYFAQQVAIEASPFPLYAPVGADDWLEPDHLERLLAVGGDAVITGAVWFHNLAGGVSVHEGSYEVGLFATDRLRAIGGHNPSERVGQDSLLIHLLRLTGEVRATSHPTYHRVKRDGSLMTSPLTGKGSPYRNELRRRNRIVLAECRALGDIERIRRFRHRHVPAAVRTEVSQHAVRLADRLREAIAA